MQQLKIAVTGIAFAFIAFTAEAAEPTFDTVAIEKITGLKGQYTEAEKVFKISRPRTDVPINVDNWKMPPFMGLTSWAAFTPVQDHLMMMGDTVVFEDEVNPAMSAAFEAGLEVTALHNHFFFDNPKVYFMHIGGMGNVGTLANGVKHVYATIDAIRKAHPEPQKAFAGSIPSSSVISAGPLEQIFGKKGESKDGMFKVSFGRPSSMHGTSIGNAMGVNTWAAFAGTDDSAVVDGDFAMLPNELQGVLKAVRAGGINVVAIHQHMTEEEPHYLFMHYWGKGKAADLANVINKALKTQSP